MNSGIYTAYSGLRSQMHALEILSNNLANVNTTGYKEEKPFFTLIQEKLEGQEAGSLGEAINNQVVLSQGRLNGAEGSLRATTRELDIALTGNGFLSVQTPQGVRYTRNGSLTLNSKSILSTQEGHPVLGLNGPIQVGQGKLTINDEGEVYADGTLADRLKLVAFDDPTALLKEGATLLAPRTGKETPKPADAKVRQGYLEQSNVNAISAVVGLVGIMRHFEAIQKSVSLLMNDINSKSIDRLGR